MRGVNVVLLSGNVGSNITYGQTKNGDSACSFSLASDRHIGNGGIITVWTKHNVYGAGLVDLCKTKLKPGGYVQVQGELMSRQGQHAELLEVRVKDIIFHPAQEKSQTDLEYSDDYDQEN